MLLLIKVLKLFKLSVALLTFSTSCEAACVLQLPPELPEFTNKNQSKCNWCYTHATTNCGRWKFNCLEWFLLDLLIVLCRGHYLVWPHGNGLAESLLKSVARHLLKVTHRNSWDELVRVWRHVITLFSISFQYKYFCFLWRHTTSFSFWLSCCVGSYCPSEDMTQDTVWDAICLY